MGHWLVPEFRDCGAGGIAGGDVRAGVSDLGALRLRTLATKDQPCADFPLTDEDGKTYHPAVILDLDYWVLMPRRD